MGSFVFLCSEIASLVDWTGFFVNAGLNLLYSLYISDMYQYHLIKLQKDIHITG